jgi:biopolymer transport protein ExbB
MNNPSAFAEGISMALIHTVAGLVVALPHLVAYNIFSSILDQWETKAESCASDVVSKQVVAHV